MPTEDTGYQELGREAVRILNEKEGKTPPSEVRGLSNDTMEELDELIEEHFISQKRGEEE